MRDRSELNRSGQIAMMVMTALMAAVLCVTGPISIPIGPVPISVGVLVLFLTVYILGTKYATIACTLYLILGFAGLPVFTMFQGGPEKLADPTGGYLIGYIPMVLIAGMVIDLTNKRRNNTYITDANDVLDDNNSRSKKTKLKSVALRAIIQASGMLVAVVVLYIFGTAWFVISTGTPIGAALTMCVIPFIPADIAKIIIAVIMGPSLAGIRKKFLQA